MRKSMELRSALSASGAEVAVAEKREPALIPDGRFLRLSGHRFLHVEMERAVYGLKNRLQGVCGSAMQVQ
jgi:hypothetical protein